MKVNIYKEITLQILPILGGVVLSYFFWWNNIVLALIYTLAIVLILITKYYPGDVHALVIGFILGLIVEIPGTFISGYQSFTNPDFLGIPMWLPIAWAYGFMFMKRIGVSIYLAKR